MEGPVSTSPLQPPHRTMRRRQLSHARSSWSSGGKQGRRWSVDRGKLNRDIPLAPWEHAIHWWLSIISSNTSYIQVINTLQKYDIAQCLFHHLRSRVIGELSNEEGNWGSITWWHTFTFITEWNLTPLRLQFSGRSWQTSPPSFQNITRIVECCPVSWIQVLNYQNFNQCLKCHKYPGLSLQLSKW